MCERLFGSIPSFRVEGEELHHQIGARTVHPARCQSIASTKPKKRGVGEQRGAAGSGESPQEGKRAALTATCVPYLASGCPWESDPMGVPLRPGIQAGSSIGGK